MALDTEHVGTKMLRPDARAVACRTRILGLAVAGASSPVDHAVRALLGLDPEADALLHARIETRQLTLGLLDRVCVTVQADVVRTISVVRLPAVGGHEGHH